jgi:hypothetical protein
MKMPAASGRNNTIIDISNEQLQKNPYDLRIR